MTIRELPDEKTLLELLALAKDFEQKARAMSEMATEITYKLKNSNLAKLRRCGEERSLSWLTHSETTILDRYIRDETDRS